MPVERREQVTCIGIVRVNGQPEELEGSSGRRQPPRGGTSRISREAYVRFCERLGVQSPGPTRRWETGRRFASALAPILDSTGTDGHLSRSIRFRRIVARSSTHIALEHNGTPDGGVDRATASRSFSLG